MSSLTATTPGLIRGIVSNNLDPAGRGRIRFRAPSVLGPLESEWAEPSMRGSTAPPLGQHVWVSFQNGDPAHPVWISMTKGSTPTGGVDWDALPDLFITAQKLADEAVEAGKIAANAVDQNAIQQAAITAEKLADGAVTAVAIGDGSVDVSKLADGSVSADKLIDGAVVSGKIAASAVGTNELAANSVVAGKIAADAVDANAIQAGSISAAKMVTGTITAVSGIIADAAITTAKIADLAVSSAKIALLAVGTANIGDGVIVSAKIGTAQILTAHIADAQIVNAKIANLAVDAAKIADATITTAKIGALQVDTGNIVNGAITNAKIGLLAVDTANIKDAAIVSAKIGLAEIKTANIDALAVVSAKIGNLEVGTIKITDSAVLTAKIADTAVATAKIQDDAINAAKILAGAVDQAELATNAVTSTKIVDAAVITAKLQDAGVLTGKLFDGAVVAAKLADNAVITAKVNDAAIVTAKLFDAAVVNAKLADLAVDTAKLAALAVSNAKIVDDAVNAAKIAVDAVGTSEIAASAVQAAEIATDAVTSTKILAGNVIAGKIGVDAVGTAEIIADGVSTAEIATNAVAAAEIQTDAVIAGKIQADAVTSVKILAGNIIAAKMATDSVLAASIKAGEVIAGKLATDSVVSANIQAGQIVTAHMVAGSINADRLVTGSVTTTQMTAGSINADRLVAGSITSNLMTANTITGDRIAANTLDAGKITAGTITTTQIAAGQVNADRLVAGSITSDRMTANTITGDRIAANSLDAAKIVAGSITSDRMTANTITGDRIQANSLDAAKIIAGSITSDRMTANTITGDRILANSLDAAKITAGTITASKIAVGALTADRLSVGITTNILRDPGNADAVIRAARTAALPARWTLVTDTADPINGAYYYSIASDAGGASTRLYFDPTTEAPVDSGKTVRVGGYIKRDATANGFLQAYVRFTLNDGTVTFIEDDFQRTVSSGWGSTSPVGTWTTNQGSTSDYNVAAGVASIILSTIGTTRRTLIQGQQDVDVVTDFALSEVPVGAAVTVGLLARVSAGYADFYTGRIQVNPDGTISTNMYKVVANGAETSVASGGTVTGITYNTPDLYLRVRFRVQGSDLKIRVWNPATTTEPATWALEATDTSLPGKGSVGTRSFRSTGSTNTAGVQVKFKQFMMMSPGDPALELDATDATTTWAPFSGNSIAPKGAVSCQLVLRNVGNTAGTWQFALPEMAVVWGVIQSAAYISGLSGFRFSDSDDKSQVEDLQVINSLGCTDLSAETITLGGDDLETEVLLDYSKGIVSYGSSGGNGWTVNSGAIGTTETGIILFSTGPVKTASRHLLVMRGHLLPSAVSGTARMYVRYTTDGSTPVAGSSSILDGAIADVHWVTTDPVSFNLSCFYKPGGDFANVKMLLCLKRVGGTGTVAMKFDDANYSFQAGFISLGNDANNTGTLAQKSKASGVADTDPPVTATTTWSASWSRSYDSDNGTRSPDTEDLYQGYYSSTHGNTRSMIGFASLTGTLTGSSISKVTLTYKVKHAYYNAGLRVRIGTHGQSSKPGTFSNIVAGIYDSGGTNKKEGSTYTISWTSSNPPSGYTWSGFTAALINGTIKGFTVGPGSSSSLDYYGYLYGADSSSKPKLSITYTK